MADVELRFVSHPGIFNRLCEFAQAGFQYTHVEAKTADGYLGALLLGGVQERPFDYDAGKFLEETLIRIKMTDEQERKFIAWLRDQRFKPYDPISILYFFSGRDWQDPDAWNCAELIAGGLVECGKIPREIAAKYGMVTVQGVFMLASAMASGGANA